MEPKYPLTERERIVLQGIAAGMEPCHVCDALGISDSVYYAEVKHIRQRLGTKNTAHSIAVGFRKKIIF